MGIFNDRKKGTELKEVLREDTKSEIMGQIRATQTKETISGNNEEFIRYSFFVPLEFPNITSLKKANKVYDELIAQLQMDAYGYITYTLLPKMEEILSVKSDGAALYSYSLTLPDVSIIRFSDENDHRMMMRFTTPRITQDMTHGMWWESRAIEATLEMALGVLDGFKRVLSVNWAALEETEHMKGLCREITHSPIIDQQMDIFNRED